MPLPQSRTEQADVASPRARARVRARTRRGRPPAERRSGRGGSGRLPSPRRCTASGTLPSSARCSRSARLSDPDRQHDARLALRRTARRRSRPPMTASAASRPASAGRHISASATASPPSEQSCAAVSSPLRGSRRGTARCTRASSCEVDVQPPADQPVLRACRYSLPPSVVRGCSMLRAERGTPASPSRLAAHRAVLRHVLQDPQHADHRRRVHRLAAVSL